MSVGVPQELVTSRPLTIAGEAIPAWTSLDNPQVISAKQLSALLGKGWIFAWPDPYGRRTRPGNPQPTYLAPVVLNAMMSQASSVVLVLTVTPDGANRKRFAVSFAGGNGPYQVQWGDGATSTVSGSSSTRTYANFSTWTVTVTDQNGASGTAQIVSNDVPSAPSGLSAVAGNASAVISFTAGSANNAAITNYQYKVGSGSWIALSPADASSPVTVPGLANDVEVSITLRAVNSVGAGASSPAVTVTPSAG